MSASAATHSFSTFLTFKRVQSCGDSHSLIFCVCVFVSSGNKRLRRINKFDFFFFFSFGIGSSLSFWQTHTVTLHSWQNRLGHQTFSPIQPWIIKAACAGRRNKRALKAADNNKVTLRKYDLRREFVCLKSAEKEKKKKRPSTHLMPWLCQLWLLLAMQRFKKTNVATCSFVKSGFQPRQ